MTLRWNFWHFNEEMLMENSRTKPNTSMGDSLTMTTLWYIQKRRQNITVISFEQKMLKVRANFVNFFLVRYFNFYSFYKQWIKKKSHKEKKKENFSLLKWISNKQAKHWFEIGSRIFSLSYVELLTAFREFENYFTWKKNLSLSSFNTDFF